MYSNKVSPRQAELFAATRIANNHASMYGAVDLPTRYEPAATGAAVMHDQCNFVMPGIVPGIHVFVLQEMKTWLAGTSPAMTGNNESLTLIESQLMDLLEISAGPAAPALTPAIRTQRLPRIWKFWGTALWGLFVFAAMFVGQIGVVAWFILRRGGPSISPPRSTWSAGA